MISRDYNSLSVNLTPSAQQSYTTWTCIDLSTFFLPASTHSRRPLDLWNWYAYIKRQANIFWNSLPKASINQTKFRQKFNIFHLILNANISIPMPYILRNQRFKGKITVESFDHWSLIKLVIPLSMTDLSWVTIQCYLYLNRSLIRNNKHCTHGFQRFISNVDMLSDMVDILFKTFLMFLKWGA